MAWNSAWDSGVMDCMSGSFIWFIVTVACTILHPFRLGMFQTLNNMLLQIQTHQKHAEHFLFYGSLDPKTSMCQKVGLKMPCRLWKKTKKTKLWISTVKSSFCRLYYLWCSYIVFYNVTSIIDHILKSNKGRALRLCNSQSSVCTLWFIYVNLDKPWRWVH